MYALQLYAFQDAPRKEVLEELGLEPPDDAESEVQGPGDEKNAEVRDSRSQVEARRTANRVPEDRNEANHTQDHLQCAEHRQAVPHDARFYAVSATHGVINGRGHREETRRAVGPRTSGAQEPRGAPVGEEADLRGCWKFLLCSALFLGLPFGVRAPPTGLGTAFEHLRLTSLLLYCRGTVYVCCSGPSPVRCGTPSVHAAPVHFMKHLSLRSLLGSPRPRVA